MLVEVKRKASLIKSSFYEPIDSVPAPDLVLVCALSTAFMDFPLLYIPAFALDCQQ